MSRLLKGTDAIPLLESASPAPMGDRDYRFILQCSMKSGHILCFKCNFSKSVVKQIFIHSSLTTDSLHMIHFRRYV
jgi:hypothetical protein